MEHDKLVIKGARENNLKNIDIEIPKNKLVIMTGLSGSGKHRWHLIQSMPKDSGVMWNR